MANADIRQLEMDGSVFYPQTDINGLVNNGSYAIDDEPTPGSENLVRSGGVASHIVYDISEAHNGTTYADLAAALGTNGANVPESIRHGGMTVSFVSNSDNKYIQYRLMSDSFNTTVANWQGVDDEPTAGSQNLVESGGVYKNLEPLHNIVKNSTNDLISLFASNTVSGGLDATGKVVPTSWTYTNNGFIAVVGGSPILYTLRTFSALAIAFYSEDNEDSFISGIEPPSGSDFAGQSTIPVNAKYMRFSCIDFANPYHVYANMRALSKQIDDINNSSVSISKAEVVFGKYINSNGEEVTDENGQYSHYTLPVYENEKINLFCGVSSSSASLVLVFFDANDVKVSYESLTPFSEQGHTFIVPYGARKVKVSFEKKYYSQLYFVHRYNGVFKNYNKKEKIPVTVSADGYLGIENAPFCVITKGNGKKLLGKGTTTITVTFQKPVPVGCVYSIGVKIPYSTQDIAEVTIGGSWSIGTPLSSPKTRSGKAYGIQGETYNRINFRSNGETQKTIVITTDPNDYWEIWVSSDIIIDDVMPITPICYIYDGGAWNGHVLYNNESISIWTLHRRLGIPYAIAETGDETSIMQQEVLDDIKSGFAEIITRVGGMNNTLYHQSDALVIEGIIDECRLHESDNMGVVLATHAFDKDVIRCLKGAKVDFVRMYPLPDGEKYKSKFSDYDIPLIAPSSVSANAEFSNKFMGLPIILWAHGVGDPQSAEQQELSDFYEDKSSAGHTAGENTIALMEKILTAQTNGEAAAMKSSEWIAYCNSH